MYVYPNPVSNNIIGLQMNSLEAGLYAVRLINLTGEIITTTTIQYPGGQFTGTIAPPVYLPAGNYHLQIVNPGKRITSVKCVVLNK